MRRVSVFPIVLLLLILFFPLSVKGDDNSSSDSDSWKVGVFEFIFTNSSNGLDYLKNSIPSHILNSVRRYPAVHELSRDEQHLRFIREREKKIISIKTEISGLRIKRDRIYLSDYPAADKELDSIKSSIAKKEEELAKIENASEDDYVETELPVVLVPEEGLGRIPDFNPDTVPLLEGMDLAVYGKIETIDKWIFITVYIYNYTTELKTKIYGKLIDPPDISNEISVINKAVRKHISGRNPPVLMVKGTPSGSYYTLDGKSNYLTGYPEDSFEEGKYTITVHKEGYYPYKTEMELRSGRITEVDYSLKRKKTGYTVISSFPSGADLYLDSRWAGRTPVILEDPVLPSYAEIVKDGYSPRKYMIGDGEERRNYRFYLSPDRIDKDKMIKYRRNKFYNSFGAFIVSLVLPVVSYGISSDYGYAYNNSLLTAVDNGESDRLMSSSTLWYNIYMGGIFLSSSLFVNMAVNLYSYISLYQ